MQHLYGNFSEQQIKEYKIKMHKEMFWLLLYKDPETKDQFKNTNYEKYFIGLMKKLDGLYSSILSSRNSIYFKSFTGRL